MGRFTFLLILITQWTNHSNMIAVMLNACNYCSSFHVLHTVHSSNSNGVLKDKLRISPFLNRSIHVVSRCGHWPSETSWCLGGCSGSDVSIKLNSFAICHSTNLCVCVFFFLYRNCVAPTDNNLSINSYSRSPSS